MASTTKDGPAEILGTAFDRVNNRSLMRVRMLNRRLKLVADTGVWDKSKPLVKLLLAQMRDTIAKAAEARAEVGRLKNDLPITPASAKLFIRRNNLLKAGCRLLVKQLTPTYTALGGMAKGPEGPKFVKAARDIEVASGSLNLRINGITKLVDKFLKG